MLYNMCKLGFFIIANNLINIESIINNISYIDPFHIDIMNCKFIDDNNRSKLWKRIKNYILLYFSTYKFK